MQYKTHLATTFAVVLPIMATTNSFTLSATAALALGSVFPDIDEPHSYIGSRTRGFSDVIGGLFGHRGITHSLAGMIIATLTFYLGYLFFAVPIVIVYYFGIGYLAHLIEDSFSKSGVAWLQPISTQSLQFGLNKIYYKTGGMIEYGIFIGSILLLIWQLSQINFDSFNIPFISNLIESFVSNIKRSLL